ncbi:MAG TPA: NUDIX domain-containing protein [Candidatus Saccharimonadales bacterium]|nr:NUDIX domain-containing protein [Candidatus Saccharimonadales bacterium]
MAEAAYRSAVAIVEVGDSLILEGRPNLPGKLRCAGKVGLFGGGLEEGETPEDGIRRELSEELVMPSGLQDIKELTQVWHGTVGEGDVSLFVARLACGAGEVDIHPDLAQQGTELVQIGVDTYPQQPTTMFTLRALAAHSTGEYENM